EHVFSENIDFVWSLMSDGSLVKHNVQTGETKLERLRFEKRMNARLAVSPDSKTLLYTDPDAKSISLFDIGSRKKTWEFPLVPHRHCRLWGWDAMFLPDRTRAVVCGNNQIYVVSITDGKQIHELPGHRGG